MLTEEELAALPPKAKRDPEVVEFYRNNDYLTAYSLHTDRRVEREGHEAAAGSDASRDNWNSHGELQRDFLVMQGLRPWHTLLDIGCGAGRLARHVTRYLEPRKYLGVDLSQAALQAALELSRSEGWDERDPRFWNDFPDDETFDFIFAHSVVTHLPPELIGDVMRDAATRLAQDGRFYWSYLPADRDERYGLTQFRTTLVTLQKCATDAGLTFEEVTDWVRKAGHQPGRWSYGQSMAVSRRR